MMVSAALSTHAVRSSSVESAVPGQVSVSGQNAHHVIFLFPIVGAQLPMSHVLSSWTVPPITTQASRSAATEHAFPIPVRQQKGGLGAGSRLPHLFLILVAFLSSIFPSFSWTSESARQLACVPPSSAHFSRTFSRFSRYLVPAFPIPCWQMPSPPVRSRWSGSGVVQSRSEHAVACAEVVPPQTPSACEG